MMCKMFSTTSMRGIHNRCCLRNLYSVCPSLLKPDINKYQHHKKQMPTRIKETCSLHRSVHHKQGGPPWRILFFGTDEFARHHLAALHREKLMNNQRLIERLDVVICTENCEVYRYAVDNELSVSHWPLSNIDSQFDVGVIVSFGHLIPKKVIEKFPMGMLNVHPSLLPYWRGASPIIHTILNGDETSGISIMSIQPKRFDTGPLFAQKELPVPPNISSLQLMRHMVHHGTSLLLDCLRELDTKPLQTQPSKTATPYAHKVKANHSYINWNKQCMHHIDRQYRALSDILPLRTKLAGRTVKLIDMEPLLDESNLSKSMPDLPATALPGTPVYHKRLNLLLVRCKDGWVGFHKVLLKKPLSALAFHNGYLSKQEKGALRFISEENDLDYFWR